MVEELKLAIKIDDDAIEQSLLKQFNNAEKMADKVVLTFKNINLDDKNIEAKFKEMQKMAGKNPIDFSISDKSVEMLSAISKQLSNIFEIAKGKSLIDSSSTVSDIGKIANATNQQIDAVKKTTSAYKNQAYELASVLKMLEKMDKFNEVSYAGSMSKAVKANAKSYKKDDIIQFSSKDYNISEEALKQLRGLSVNLEEAFNYSDTLGLDTATIKNVEVLIQYFRELLKEKLEFNNTKLNTADIEELIKALGIAKKEVFDDGTGKKINSYDGYLNKYSSVSEIISFLKQQEQQILATAEAEQKLANVEQQSSNSSLAENQDKIQQELKETEKVAEQTAEALEKINSNGDKSNISSGNPTMKDVFQNDSNSSSTAKEEASVMEQVESATEQAVQAKKDFATANEGVQDSVADSKSPLQLEAELMQQIAKDARDAADAKKEFVEANKQVKDSADDSNETVKRGHSENAEPSGTKKYKKKGYKAHDTGNHDNEVTVTKKSELGKVLKDLQTEIIASLDETTSFIKEVTDFYDSADNLVKTQMKVVDKDGSQRTYTTSYSTDKDGNATAWTSHIDSQKFKNTEEQEAKEIQKVWEDNLKAITDYMDAKTKLNNLEASDKKSNKKSNEIADLTQEVEKAKVKAEEARIALSSMVNPNNVDIDTWDKWLKMMEDFRQAGDGSSKSIAKLKDAIANVNTSELQTIDKYIESAQKKLNSTKSSRDDSEKSSSFKTYEKDVQECIDALIAERNRLENAVKSGDIEIIDEGSLSNLNNLKQKLEDTNSEFKTMFKGSAEVSRWKEIDTITKYMEKNTRISKEAKDKLREYIETLKTNGADANVEEIHKAFLRVCDGERKAKREGQSFLDVLRDKVWYQWAAQIGSYFSLNDILDYGKQAVETIIELDTALVDLKKTTAMSSSQMEDFYFDANDVAKEMGATTKEIIEQASAWSRLGLTT